MTLAQSNAIGHLSSSDSSRPVNNDWNVRQRVILANMLKRLEPRHIRQLSIKNDAIGWLFPSIAKASRPLSAVTTSMSW